MTFTVSMRPAPFPFHKILDSQSATDMPNEKEETSTAMNGR